MALFVGDPLQNMKSLKVNSERLSPQRVNRLSDIDSVHLALYHLADRCPRRKDGFEGQRPGEFERRPRRHWWSSSLEGRGRIEMVLAGILYLVRMRDL